MVSHCTANGHFKKRLCNFLIFTIPGKHDIKWQCFMPRDNVQKIKTTRSVHMCYISYRSFSLLNLYVDFVLPLSHLINLLKFDRILRLVELRVPGSSPYLYLACSNLFRTDPRIIGHNRNHIVPFRYIVGASLSYLNDRVTLHGGSKVCCCICSYK